VPFKTDRLKTSLPIDAPPAVAMPGNTERKTPEIPYAVVGESPALVDPAKSRRLREMLNNKNAGMQNRQDAAAAAVESGNPFDLPSEAAKELLRARQIIDDEIARIMSAYPEGRKNSLFKLRFGTLEEIRAMEVRAIFKLLKLDCRRANLNRLQKIDYFGKKIS
jgi:hypothetical protein